MQNRKFKKKEASAEKKKKKFLITPSPPPVRRVKKLPAPQAQATGRRSHRRPLEGGRDRRALISSCSLSHACALPPAKILGKKSQGYLWVRELQRTFFSCFLIFSKFSAKRIITCNQKKFKTFC